MSKKKAKKPAGPFQLMLRQARHEKRDAVKDARTQYRRSVGDLNYIHQQAGNYLQGLTDRTNTSFADTGNAQSARHAALQQQLAQQADLSRRGANEEQERLGLAGIGTPGLDAEASLAQQVAATIATNDQSNLGFSKNSFNEVANLLLGGNAGSRTSALGQVLQSRNDAIMDARQKLQEQAFEIRLKRAEERQRRAAMQQSMRNSYSNGGGYSRSGYTPYSKTSTADKTFVDKTGATTSTKRQDQGRKIGGHNPALLSLLGGPLVPKAPRKSKPAEGGKNNAFSDFHLYSMLHALGGKKNG